MKLSKSARTILLGSVLLTVASSGSTARSASEIAVQDRANANASLAASGRFAAVVWGASTKEGVTDIFVTASRDGGRTYGPPSRVNLVAGDVSVSGEQPPRIALVPRTGRDPAIVVVWTAKSPVGTRLWSARSEDGGKSFASPTIVPGADASGNRGWESIATNREGEVVSLWLDHRELSNAGTGTTAKGHADHQHGAAEGHQMDAVARAQLSKLFFGRLDAPTSARALAGGVCYCCKTSIATGTNGAIYAAWRQVYPGSVRDIAFAMSSDGGRAFSTPVRVSEDNWVLDGCPENGPALGVDGDQRVHVVWPTLVPGVTAAGEPTLALFYAMSRDGRHFTARQRVPTEGVPRHPQIALGSRGEIVVAWDEQASGSRRIALARGTVDRNGTARFVRQPIGDAAPAVYPVLGAVDDGTVVAWTSGSSGQTVIRHERLDR
jgi:hypothetical protein